MPCYFAKHRNQHFCFVFLLQVKPHEAPFLCIRVVTRGDYPGLVRDNVKRNLAMCLDTGIDNFVIEVVTDKAVYNEKELTIQADQSILNGEPSAELSMPQIVQQLQTPTQADQVERSNDIRYTLLDLTTLLFGSLTE